ncbi:MAG: Ni/Fe hydrogenase subunit alpha [Fimbriimonadales bacterium]|nr:Ni/Fe hydrogenase subunit alpha [Fimbriimonadales bacterium]
MRTRNLKVDLLARVEGEGALTVRIRGDQVQDAKLSIYEPPRFFEAFLVGRHCAEAPDITARICGICPIAYQISASRAIEEAFGVSIDPMVRALRRLIYCGEWIESHVLHVAMLHAPDFLGYADAIEMAKDHPDVVRTALRLKKVGNDVMALLGGREIHPVNVRIGGFYKVPTRSELQALRPSLEWALEAADQMADLVAGFPFPEFHRSYEFVGLRNPPEYPLFDGKVVSSAGVELSLDQFEEHFPEEHVEHSNALHSARRGAGGYQVGPMARFNLNFDLLTPRAKQAAKRQGLEPPVTNPFRSIVVRAVETIFACEEALRILDLYQEPERPFEDFEPREAKGCGCSEAPRGICFHSYEVGSDGLIRRAHIMPPTAQNLRCVEEDLAQVVAKNLDKPDTELQWLCEQAVRNYDPCISCATHFLKLRVERL